MKDEYSRAGVIRILEVRDGLTHDEAVALLDELVQEVREGLDLGEALYDIGLEPDYVFAILESL